LGIAAGNVDDINEEDEMYACVCVAWRRLDARKGKGWFERPKDGGDRTRNSRWKQRTAVGSSGWQVEGGKGVTAAAVVVVVVATAAAAVVVVIVIVVIVVVRGGREGRGSGERGGEGGSGERRSRRRRAVG